MNTYDVIIIGGGAGGLTAGIYSSREMLSTLLIEKNLVGGLAAETELIENYPGFPEGINGMDLMDKMKDQAQNFGVEIAEFEEVESIKPVNESEIIVKTVKDEYRAHSVIVASGTVPKFLNIPGEKEFLGKGISYCATCDGPLYKDKQVAVIGCGNSGLQEGESLLKHAREVTFIEFLPNMTASKILQQRLKKNKKATFFLNHALVRIDGDKFVESITVKNRDNGKKKKLEVSGVFMYTGFLPVTDFIEKTEVKLDKKGYIKTNDKMETSVPGIYAIGDIVHKVLRQVVTASADGAIAAFSAEKWIEENKENF